jgi:methylmalonyl-CoA mutase N-terminal domain/subunit
VLAKKTGVSFDKLKGTTQNDVLKEYIARGTYIYPPKGAMKLTTDVISFCKEQVPNWNTISISGYHIREAGSTAVQEVAFTLADGIAYVEAALKAGLTVDEFAPRLSFFFNCHNNFFEEIAKFRAARTLWATIMKERFGAKKPESWQLRFHTQTAGSSLTAQQPLNNIVRTTIQALAAVLGGTQSLHTNGFDEALGLPTQNAATIALRTQQIIAHESGVADVVDALGGSALVESLTDKIIDDSSSLISKIDELGGMVLAIENNFPQSEIEKAAYQYQQSIEDKSHIIVGINQFIADHEEDVQVEPIRVKDEQLQVERLQTYKNSRDAAKVKSSLNLLESAARSDQNTMPLTISALEAGATLGEISDCFRAIWGEYHGI